MRQITIRLADPSDAAALCDMHQDFTSYANTLQMPYTSRKFWEHRMSQGDQSATRWSLLLTAWWSGCWVSIRTVIPAAAMW